jgi:GH24 family phage-related lysozyme (muramidase)
MAEVVYKVLHYLDVLKCSNGGFVELYDTVLERNTEIEEDLKVLTDQDLLKRVSIQGCSLSCSKITSITVGLAKDLEVRAGAIPVLSNLEAVTNKGCIVKHTTTLVDQLAVGEGRFKSMYKDSVGVPTVGVGFNLIKDGAKKRIEALGLKYDDVLSGKQSLTDAQIDTLFADDQVIAENSAKKSITNWDSLSSERQKALTDMCFNLGSLHDFPNFAKAVNAGDWAKAAKEAGRSSDGKSPSKWVTQVGRRAKRIIAQIRGDEAWAAPK